MVLENKWYEAEKKIRIKLIRIGVPQPGEKVIKGSNTWCVTNFKAAENRIQRIHFKLCGPFSDGSNFKINGKKIGTLHARGSSWRWTELGIFVLHHFIGIQKIKIPKTIYDIPSITSKSIRIRIIFTKICNNKVLLVSMTVAINR